MTRSEPRFKAGQLVWISSRVDGWASGLGQVAKGYPPRIMLTAGAACTVIRKAQARDFGTYARHTHGGTSTAMRAAATAWLVLYEGAPTMIDNEWLIKRYYTPRKRKE
jgi:hypothetical protein